MNVKLLVPLTAALLTLVVIPSASGVQESRTETGAIQTHTGSTVEQVVVHQRRGQRQECHSDTCSLVALEPIRFQFLTAPQGYDALITVSMNYRTTRNDRFSALVVVKRPGTRNELGSFPQYRPLASGKSQFGTFQWLVGNLSGGDDYDLFVQPKVQDREGGYLVAFRRLIVTVQAVPRS